MQTSTATLSATPKPAFNPVITDEIRITPAAQNKLAALFAELDDDEVNAVRVYVSGGGCGGMSYGMTFTDQRNANDCVLDGDGFSIYVDVVALGFLRGVEVDFVERGAQGASFVFNNAFAATASGGTCGTCGAAGGGCA